MYLSKNKRSYFVLSWRWFLYIQSQLSLHEFGSEAVYRSFKQRETASMMRLIRRIEIFKVQENKI